MTLQKARADRNLEPFRTQLTDLMYNQWKARTDALSARHRRTVLTRLEIENASIARILVESAAAIIAVEFEGTVIIGDRTNVADGCPPVPQFPMALPNTGPSSDIRAAQTGSSTRWADRLTGA